MDIESFKKVYASKSPVEKLDLLMLQVDYYGDDKKNYADARCRLNGEKAQYYYNEAVAMMERIICSSSLFTVGISRSNSTRGSPAVPTMFIKQLTRIVLLVN